MTIDTKPEKESPFKKWYSTNKESLSDTRKARYKNDAAYREEVLERQRKYREDHPTPSRAGESRIKTVNGKKVEVFRITEAGTMIGRCDQTLRDWEAKGIIPKPTVQSAHRYYTKFQVTLLKELADLIDVVRYEGELIVQTAIKNKSIEIHSKWAIIGG